MDGRLFAEAASDLSDRWSHEYGVVFMLEAVAKTNNDRYLQYIKNSYEANINENGEIRVMRWRISA